MQIPIAALVTLIFGLSGTALARFVAPAVRHIAGAWSLQHAAALVVPLLQLVVVVAIAAFYKSRARPPVATAELLGGTPRRPALTYLVAAALGVTLQPLLGQVATWLTGFTAQGHTRDAWLHDVLSSPNALVVASVAVVLSIAPALGEELLFRGVIFSGVRRYHTLGTTWLVSSLLFGIAHPGFVAVAYATLAGLVLGFIRAATRSLGPCLIAHVATNAAGVAAAKFAPLDAQWYAFPLGEFAVFGLLLALLAILLVALSQISKRAP